MSPADIQIRLAYTRLASGPCRFRYMLHATITPLESSIPPFFHSLPYYPYNATYTFHNSLLPNRTRLPTSPHLTSSYSYFFAKMPASALLFSSLLFSSLISLTYTLLTYPNQVIPFVPNYSAQQLDRIASRLSIPCIYLQTPFLNN